jgi:chaperonin GroES
MFRPLHDRVLVKRLEPETKIGSLHVPGAAQAKAQRGEVIAVGKGARTDKGVLLPPHVKPGDHVAFGKYAGEDMRLSFGGEEYITMREDEILAILEGAAPAISAEPAAPGPELYRG